MDPAPQLPLSLDTCSANDVRKWRGWEQRFCVRKRRQKTAGYTHEQRRPSLSLGPNEARSSTSPAFRSPAERRKGRGGDALSFPDDKTGQAPLPQRPALPPRSERNGHATPANGSGGRRPTSKAGLTKGGLSRSKGASGALLTHQGRGRTTKPFLFGHWFRGEVESERRSPRVEGINKQGTDARLNACSR